MCWTYHAGWFGAEWCWEGFSFGPSILYLYAYMWHWLLHVFTASVNILSSFYNQSFSPLQLNKNKKISLLVSCAFTASIHICIFFLCLILPCLYHFLGVFFNLHKEDQLDLWNLLFKQAIVAGIKARLCKGGEAYEYWKIFPCDAHQLIGENFPCNSKCMLRH